MQTNLKVREDRTYIPLFRNQQRVRRAPDTQQEFEKLLDLLRPHPKVVTSTFIYDERDPKMIGVRIHADGKLMRVIHPFRQDVETFAEEVDSLVNFYKNPPRLWPNCRNDIANYINVEKNKEFNRWFDEYANAGKH